MVSYGPSNLFANPTRVDAVANEEEGQGKRCIPSQDWRT